MVAGLIEKNVLIVSSDPVLLGFLYGNLTGRGFKVTDIKDDDAGLQVVLNIALPDLIIVDIKMPWLDGLGVCLGIRQMSQAPILMLSAWRVGKNEARGIDLARDCYVTQPFGGEELMVRIEKTLCRNEPCDEFLSRPVSSVQYRRLRPHLLPSLESLERYLLPLPSLRWN